MRNIFVTNLRRQAWEKAHNLDLACEKFDLHMFGLTFVIWKKERFS